MLSRSLAYSYTVLAPLYDALVALPTRHVRQKSVQQLGDVSNETILFMGIGSGLDIPYLATEGHYVGIDLTLAMLRRAQKQKEHYPAINLALHQGDVMQLPYQDNSFDEVVMHLILAVVPDPQAALNEASRVVKQGGRIIILDKFLSATRPAPIRRLISPLIGKIVTRTDVVFEHLQYPKLEVIQNTPALARGWFRHIILQKNIM